VVAAYPITPQTEIVETIADFVTSGQMKSRYIPVESEHSAMAACIGASITGVRTFTATSAHGLLYMHEMTNWAAGARLPIVMANVNRSLGPGWNIWAEHTDAMQERDTGWLQVYVSTVQEAYDTTLMAFRIAEHNDCAPAGDGKPRRLCPLAYHAAARYLWNPGTSSRRSTCRTQSM